MTFREVVLQAYDTPELLAEFDRLTGANLSLKGSVLDIMIDEASGKRAADLERFVAFVRDAVWDRLPPATPEPPAEKGGGE